MALRYLRRPLKAASRKSDVRKAKRSMPLRHDAAAGLPAVEVTSDECAKLAQALAYFCVACGREHASGDIRDGDIACAESEIIDVIKGAS